ncbi:hypothetical protein ARALYDRAFT_904528 [Arabidopsis lyrata subsp. lyrata]|uniref:Zinc finger family protein n=1 Tax=Arabidopsis lyrata subsp. lyrata TaxID=81972 RepID=D7LQ85_ARALL|nr:hypothetical protein ARALYDRAFT_920787 [Arabidopsis lyrata subsp. lyrata]EFH53098.1 hypothetical protein ARALYDRAFT_904528 [Arabidopsis lyrata subsp. lyrata]
MNMGEGSNVSKSKQVVFTINLDDDCRICLKSLADDRTPVKLLCGHQYHLALQVKISMYVPLVHPLMGGLPTPVRRESILPLIGRQLGAILPNSTRPSTMSQPLMDDFPAPVRRESVLPSVERKFGTILPNSSRSTVVQPLMDGLPAPVRRESVLPSVGRQFDVILPNSARSTVVQPLMDGLPATGQA